MFFTPAGRKWGAKRGFMKYIEGVGGGKQKPLKGIVHRERPFERPTKILSKTRRPAQLASAERPGILRLQNFQKK